MKRLRGGSSSDETVSGPDAYLDDSGASSQCASKRHRMDEDGAACVPSGSTSTVPKKRRRDVDLFQPMRPSKRYGQVSSDSAVPMLFSFTAKGGILAGEHSSSGLSNSELRNIHIENALRHRRENIPLSPFLLQPPSTVRGREGILEQPYNVVVGAFWGGGDSSCVGIGTAQVSVRSNRLTIFASPVKARDGLAMSTGMSQDDLDTST